MIAEAMKTKATMPVVLKLTSMTERAIIAIIQVITSEEVKMTPMVAAITAVAIMEMTAITSSLTTVTMEAIMAETTMMETNEFTTMEGVKMAVTAIIAIMVSATTVMAIRKRQEEVVMMRTMKGMVAVAIVVTMPTIMKVAALEAATMVIRAVAYWRK